MKRKLISAYLIIMMIQISFFMDYSISQTLTANQLNQQSVFSSSSVNKVHIQLKRAVVHNFLFPLKENGQLTGVIISDHRYVLYLNKIYKRPIIRMINNAPLSSTFNLQGFINNFNNDYLMQLNVDWGNKRYVLYYSKGKLNKKLSKRIH